MLQLRYEEQGVPKTAPLEAGRDGHRPSRPRRISFSPTRASRATTRRFAWSTRSAVFRTTGSRFGTFLEGRRPVHDEVQSSRSRRHDQGSAKSCSSSSSVAEKDLLTEDHQISEGPGTIMRPDRVPRSARLAAAASRRHLVRLLADVNRTLLTTQSLTDVLNSVVELAFGAVPAERAFLMLRESADEAFDRARAPPSRRVGARRSRRSAAWSSGR